MTDVICSLDPADTHHARSNNCQVKSLLLQKMLVADLSLDKAMLQDVVKRKL